MIYYDFERFVVIILIFFCRVCYKFKSLATRLAVVWCMNIRWDLNVSIVCSLASCQLNKSLRN